MLESRKRWSRVGLAGTVATVVLLAGAAVTAQEVVAPDPDGDGPSVYFVSPDPHSGYLGVRLEEETEWAEGGARVTKIVTGSPAEDAGLETGDIVVSFDGKTIRGPVGLTNAIHEKKPGDSVELTVVRNGRTERMTVELGDRGDRFSFAYSSEPFELLVPELDDKLRNNGQRVLEYLERAERFAPRSCDDDDENCQGFNYRFLWSGRPRLGVQLADTTPELLEHLGSPDGTGVLVSKVLRGTPAEHAGVEVGDVIVRVGDSSIEDLSDLREALADKTGEAFGIEVVRDKQIMNLEVVLPETDRDAVTGPRARLVAPRAHPIRVRPVRPVRPIRPTRAVAPVAPPAPRVPIGLDGSV